MKRLAMIRKTIAIDEKTIDELDHYAKKEAMDFSSALRHALKIGLLVSFRIKVNVMSFAMTF